MYLKSERDITQIISKDQWMMDILKAAKQLDLSDWWICAGFIRSKIWDVLHDFKERTVISDIDVIYFDKKIMVEAEEKKLEKVLHEILPEIPWSVKNEARMHVQNNLNPYLNAEDAIAKFPETVTALAVRLDNNGQLELTAPHGVKDVVNMIVRPTPFFSNSRLLMDIYHERIKAKDWGKHWYLLRYSDLKESPF